jgi:hypothetical protein
MGSQRLTLAVGAGICVGAFLALVSLASRTLGPVLAVVGAIPPALVAGLLFYFLAPRRPGSSSHDAVRIAGSPRWVRMRTYVDWIGAAISGVLLLVCLQGMFVFAEEAKRRDPTAGNHFGAVLLVFGLAVVFESPLMLRLSPIGRRRWTTAVVLSLLIAGSWIGGLALNSGQ